MPGVNPMQPEILEAESEHLARGFRAVSVAPERHTDPIAELGAIVFDLRSKTNTAAQPLTFSQEDSEAGAFALLPNSLAVFEKPERVFLRVWMRNAKGSSRYFASADQWKQLRNILPAEGPQH